MTAGAGRSFCPAAPPVERARPLSLLGHLEQPERLARHARLDPSLLRALIEHPESASLSGTEPAGPQREPGTVSGMDRHRDQEEQDARHAAFIRNIMVGREGLTRSVLLGATARAGGRQPRSYLSTGNITFTTPVAMVDRVRRALEDAVRVSSGRSEPVFLRSINELRGLAQRDSFGGQPYSSVHERCVTFLPDGTEWIDPLPESSRRNDVELIDATDRAVFSVTRLVGGRPGTAGPLVEQRLGVLVTTRNWNTVARILANPL